MKTINGKSIEEVDEFDTERKQIFIKLLETLLVTSYGYANEFSKFMIGLNSTLFAAYLAYVKLSDLQTGFFIYAPFALQVITILFYLLAVHPREMRKDKDSEKPLIFNPDMILDVYNKSLSEKSKWVKLGTFSFVAQLLLIFAVMVK